MNNYFSRNITNKINYIFDNLLPPFLRNQKWFMWIPFKIVFGEKANFFFTFKERVPFLNDSQILEIYKATSSVHINRPSDLNKKCLDKILLETKGASVLDVGCGSGYLSNLLENSFDVTSVDFMKSEHFDSKNKNTRFVEASVTNLPFKNNCFDTVICTHTLEHVKDINKAITEIRRVCRKKLIIVVPKQRAYKYTFDLHVHFFPYEFSFLNIINRENNNYYINSIQGDIYYQETY